jgi:hypothetical protein
LAIEGCAVVVEAGVGPGDGELAASGLHASSLRLEEVDFAAGDSAAREEHRVSFSSGNKVPGLACAILKLRNAESLLTVTQRVFRVAEGYSPAGLLV